MAWYDDVVSSEIKTTIAFMRGWISQEHTRRGPRSQFMRRTGLQIWVAKTPKNLKVLIGRWSSVQACVGNFMANGRWRTVVDQVCGYGKDFSPIGQLHGSMNKHRAHWVINGAKHTLSLPILRECIGSRKAKSKAMGSQISDSGIFNKFFTIISFKHLVGRPNCVLV